MTAISEALSDEKLTDLVRRLRETTLGVHMGRGYQREAPAIQIEAAEVIQSLRSGNGGEVRVKALEWSSTIEGAEFAGGLYSEAQSPLGVYMAWGSGMWRGPSSGASKHVGDIATAKAAAQADYETRILSALDIKP